MKEISYVQNKTRDKLHCYEKESYEFMIDHRSHTHKLSSCEIKA